MMKGVSGTFVKLLMYWCSHLAHDGSVMLYQNIKKLSMINQSDSLFTKFTSRHSGVINSTMLLVYLFHCRLLSTEIFECAKITRLSHKKFCNFAVIEGNPMPLGIFM